MLFSPLLSMRTLLKVRLCAVSFMPLARSAAGMNSKSTQYVTTTTDRYSYDI